MKMTYVAAVLAVLAFALTPATASLAPSLGGTVPTTTVPNNSSGSIGPILPPIIGPQPPSPPPALCLYERTCYPDQNDVPLSCQFGTNPFGGVVGDTYGYAQEMGAWTCYAGIATAQNGAESAGDTAYYAADQVRDTTTFLASQSINLQPTAAYVLQMEGIAGNQVVTQGNLACDLLFGAPCLASTTGGSGSSSAAPAGVCPDFAPNGGVVGDVLTYSEDACGAADSGAMAAAGATVAYAGTVGGQAREVLTDSLYFAKQRSSELSDYSDEMTGNAVTEAGVLATTANGMADATCNYLVGQDCPDPVITL